MNYLVFESEQEANEAESAIWQTMQPIVERNAKTNSPVETPITTRWAIPAQRLDGKWVFRAPDFETEYESETYDYAWFPDLSEEISL